MSRTVIAAAALVVLLAGVGVLAGSRADVALDPPGPVETTSPAGAVPEPSTSTPPSPGPATPSAVPALPPPSAAPTTPPPSAPPPAPAAPAEPGAALWGHTFVSVSVTEGGRPRPMVEGTRLEVTFERRDDGVDIVRWRAGCNTMGGKVVVSADRLDVSEIAGTGMGCDEARHAQDEWTASFFEADPFWSSPDGGLRLEAGDTVIDLVPAS